MARKHPLLEWANASVRRLEGYRQSVLIPLMRDRERFEAMPLADRLHVGRLQNAIDLFVHDHTVDATAQPSQLVVIYGDGVREHEDRIRRLGELESMETLVSYVLTGKVSM